MMHSSLHRSPASRPGRGLPVLLLLAALLGAGVTGCAYFGSGKPAAGPAAGTTSSNGNNPTPPPAIPRDWPYAETPGVPDGLKVHRLLKVVSLGAGSASLDGEARGALGIAAEELATNPAWHVLVVGHADNQGEKAGGENLGQSRARAAAEHLRARGVARERLSLQSLGSTYAQGDRYALEQVRRDRRVEVWVFLP